jgi:hypothetical protein
VLHRVANFAGYLIERGSVIGDGDTIGSSTEERITPRRAGLRTCRCRSLPRPAGSHFRSPAHDGRLQWVMSARFRDVLDESALPSSPEGLWHRSEPTVRAKSGGMGAPHP